MQSQKSILLLCSEHSPVASTSETALFNHKRQVEAGGGGADPYSLAFQRAGLLPAQLITFWKRKKGGISNSTTYQDGIFCNVSILFLSCVLCRRLGPGTCVPMKHPVSPPWSLSPLP